MRKLSLHSKSVIVGTPVLRLGGTELQTLAMVRILVKNGYQVTIYCYYEYDESIVYDFRSTGATVRLLNLDRSTRRMSEYQLLKLFRTLMKIFRAEKPDIVHVQYLAPGLIPILAATFAGVKKVFATIHYPRHLFGKREERFMRIAARLCSMFFCNSLATERSWFGTGAAYDEGGFNPNSSHCTIYNAIDVRKIEKAAHSISRTAMKKQMGINTNLVIGIVARLRSEKGHSFLFHAMKLLLQSAPRTTLLVIGDGPDKSALQSLAEKLHIADNVFWLGAKSQDETFRLYGLMDVVAVPSEFEGFGLSAAEAMAAGLPIVASDVDGLREVVDNGRTGLLVPFGDIARMSFALSAFLTNPKKRREMGKNGTQRVEQLFPISRFRKAILTAYDRF